MILSKKIKEIAFSYNDVILKETDNNFANTVFIGQNNIYKITSSEHKISKGDHLKEKIILQLLDERLDKEFSSLIPKFVEGFLIDDGLYLQIHQKLDGSHPKNLSNSIIASLGKFVSQLHRINNFKAISEFENSKKIDLKLSEYLQQYSLKYFNKLKDIVHPADFKILEDSFKLVQNLNVTEIDSVELVLVHKDLYCENILVTNEKISGIIDWEASQIAPKEWELAILLQRMPKFWKEFISNYSHEYNPYVLKICGLTQSLRFWKSFPSQQDFVNQQKEFLMKLIANDNI